MANQNALTYDLTYGDGIERVWTKQGGGDTKVLDTVAAGAVIVSIMDEDVVDELQAQHKLTGDLATGVPSISVEIDGKLATLTWQEAYNLSEMLTRQVNVALYG